MKIEIGKYKIIKQDEYNFALSKSVPKGSAFGKVGVGEKDKLIGYYGQISGALNKMLNNEILESDDIVDVKSILEAISRVETLIESTFKKDK